MSKLPGLADSEEYIDLRRLITAEEIEGRLGGRITKDRIEGWADAGIIPHYLLENDRLFEWDEVMRAIKQNLLIRREANPVRVLPLSYALPGSLPPIPQGISHLQQYLVRVPVASLGEAKWPGVYFLCHAGEIVYIGQTARTVSGRVGQHCRYKTFDSAFAVRLDPLDLDYVEAELIKHFRPIYNCTAQGEPFCSRLTYESTRQAKEIVDLVTTPN